MKRSEQREVLDFAQRSLRRAILEIGDSSRTLSGYGWAAEAFEAASRIPTTSRLAAEAAGVQTLAQVTLNIAERGLRDPEDAAAVKEIDRLIEHAVTHSLNWERTHGHH